MNVEQLLSEVEHLDKNALEQLKERIAQREEELHTRKHPQTAQEWNDAIDHFLNDFWADTPAEEQTAIVEAMRIKNIPPNRDTQS